MAHHLLTNAQWRLLVAELLAGKPDARALLRNRVEFYIRHLAPLRTRPPADSDYLRAQLAARVIGALEADDFQMLRGWYDRSHDVPEWWTWIKAVTLAIEHRVTAWVPRDEWVGRLAEGTQVDDLSGPIVLDAYPDG